MRSSDLHRYQSSRRAGLLTELHRTVSNPSTALSIPSPGSGGGLGVGVAESGQIAKKILRDDQAGPSLAQATPRLTATNIRDPPTTPGRPIGCLGFLASDFV